MSRNQRRIGPLSRLEPMKKCASISCLTPRKSSGGSVIHAKFKRENQSEEIKQNTDVDLLLYPPESMKTKTPNK